MAKLKLVTATIGRGTRIHLVPVTAEQALEGDLGEPLCERATSRVRRSTTSYVESSTVTCQACVRARRIWDLARLEQWRRENTPATSSVVTAPDESLPLYQSLMRDLATGRLGRR